MNLVIEHTDIGHGAHPQDPTAFWETNVDRVYMREKEHKKEFR